jgi:hypothetical protein
LSSSCSSSLTTCSRCCGCLVRESKGIAHFHPADSRNGLAESHQIIPLKLIRSSEGEVSEWLRRGWFGLQFHWTLIWDQQGGKEVAGKPWTYTIPTLSLAK